VRGENGGIKAGYIGEWALKKEKWRENYILVEGKLYFGWGKWIFGGKIGGNRFFARDARKRRSPPAVTARRR
jgi:hypothetical protein